MFKSIFATAGFSLLAGGVALGQSAASNQNSAVHNNISQPRLVAHSVPSPSLQDTPPVIVSPLVPVIPQPRTSPCPAGTPSGTWCAGKAL